MTTAASPPGPPPHRFLGNLPEFARDVLGFFTATARDYGDIASMRFGGRAALLLTNPEHIEQVLVGQQRNFVKHTWFWRHVDSVFGQGLLTGEGDHWLRQRRTIQPAFHKDRIAGYADVMVDFTERALDDWRDGERRELHRDMMGLTLEIVAKVLFDADVTEDLEEVDRALDTATSEIAARFRRPFPIPDWIPIPGNLRYRSAVRLLDKVVYRFIREHEARGPKAMQDGEDLLSTLMALSHEDGSGMSREQVRDEAVTMLLAGHETTALALSWTFCLLSQNPAAEKRLHDEVDRVLGARTGTSRRLTVTDLPQLRWAEHIVTESMRLYPPAYAIGREAVADCMIGGYPVAAGTTLFIVPWVTHRDPRWFDDPESFRPERWEDGLADRLPRFVYMPFGGGPRLCIGNRFATMEAVLILAAVARRFRVRLEPDRMPTPFPSITLRPGSGVRARVEERS
jgi:cytochrome P450